MNSTQSWSFWFHHALEREDAVRPRTSCPDRCPICEAGQPVDRATAPRQSCRRVPVIPGRFAGPPWCRERAKCPMTFPSTRLSQLVWSVCRCCRFSSLPHCGHAHCGAAYSTPVENTFDRSYRAIIQLTRKLSPNFYIPVLGRAHSLHYQSGLFLECWHGLSMLQKPDHQTGGPQFIGPLPSESQTACPIPLISSPGPAVAWQASGKGPKPSRRDKVANNRAASCCDARMALVPNS